MMQTFKKITSLVLCTSFLSLVALSTVSAQGIKSSGGPLSKVAKKAGTTEKDIGDIAGVGVNAVLQLVGLIFMILMVYAGILWMTARGKDDQVEKARKIVAASMIGLVITVSAYAITIFVTGRFEG